MGSTLGGVIKKFDKEFEREIRARHGVHHHEAFDEVAISRIALLELTGFSDEQKRRDQAYKSYYRQTANEWASRTSRRAETLDQFVEAVADALLNVCPFLVSDEDEDKQ